MCVHKNTRISHCDTNSPLRALNGDYAPNLIPIKVKGGMHSANAPEKPLQNKGLGYRKLYKPTIYFSAKQKCHKEFIRLKKEFPQKFATKNPSTTACLKALSKTERFIYFLNRGLLQSNNLSEQFDKAEFEAIDFLCDHKKAPGEGRCSSCQEEYEELCNESTAGIIEKEIRKIRRCGRYIAARYLPTKEAIHLGAKSCGSRFCPYCTFKKGMTRKEDARSWIGESRELLSSKHLYHMVLTLRHGIESDRRGDYSSELIEYFDLLRTGKGAAFTKIWKQAIWGGYYSVEVKKTRSQDGTLNIHLHVFLVANQDLWKSQVKVEKTEWVESGELNSRGKPKKVREKVAYYHNFIEEIKQRWQSITGDSDVINIDPIYYIDNSGEKIEFHPGKETEENMQCLDRAVEETLKYTLKADFNDILDCGKELEHDSEEEPTEGEKTEYALGVVASLIAPKRKLFNCFGKMWGQGIFSKSDQDETEIELSDKELFSPSTSEIFEEEETDIIVTDRNNLEVVTTNDITHYLLRDSDRVIFCDSAGDAVEAMNTLSLGQIGDVYKQEKRFESKRARRERLLIENIPQTPKHRKINTLFGVEVKAIKQQKPSKQNEEQAEMQGRMKKRSARLFEQSRINALKNTDKDLYEVEMIWKERKVIEQLTEKGVSTREKFEAYFGNQKMKGRNRESVSSDLDFNYKSVLGNSYASMEELECDLLVSETKPVIELAKDFAREILEEIERQETRQEQIRLSTRTWHQENTNA